MAADDANDERVDEKADRVDDVEERGGRAAAVSWLDEAVLGGERDGVVEEKGRMSLCARLVE